MTDVVRDSPCGDLEKSAGGLTRAIARLVIRPWLNVSEESLGIAKSAFLDTLSVAHAAAGEPVVSRLVPLESRISGPCETVTGDMVDVEEAALINGCAAHALDADDNLDAIKGHPSAVLVPTILAVGQARASSGRELLDAYMAGFQANVAVAAAMDIDDHFASGWHSTGTIGVLGATLAACRLWRMTVPEAQRALGIASSMASGLNGNFGSMTKALHAGLAARNGIVAAKWARAGLTANPDQIEAPSGYLTAFNRHRNPNYEDALKVLNRNDILVHYRPTIKRYPSCAATHCAIDIALYVGRNIQLSDIAQVNITVPPGALLPLPYTRPTNAAEARFSMQYVVAAALVDQAVGPAQFTDIMVRRPNIKSLMSKITARETNNPPNGSGSWTLQDTVLKITLADGSTLSRRCHRPLGHETRPLSQRQRHDKARVYMTKANMNAERIEQFIRVVDRLETLPDVRDLLASSGSGDQS